MKLVVILFDSKLENVACVREDGKFLFPSDNIDITEGICDGTHRIAKESLELSEDDFSMKFLRSDNITMYNGYSGENVSSVIVMTGIIKDGVKLPNDDCWFINVGELELFKKMPGDGIYSVYVNQACNYLKTLE